mgnify:CR=1 FL=1
MRILPFLTVVVVLTGASALSQEPSVDRAIVEAEFDRNTFSEDIVRIFHRKFGDAATPVLMDILAAPESNALKKGKASFYLGVMGESSALPEVVRFIEDPVQGELPDGYRLGLYFAIGGIGFLAQNDQEAFTYLMKMNSIQYWTTRIKENNMRFSGQTEEKTLDFILTAGYSALACTGTTQGLDALERIYHAPEGRSTTGLDTAIDALKSRIMRLNAESTQD